MVMLLPDLTLLLLRLLLFPGAAVGCFLFLQKHCDDYEIRADPVPRATSVSAAEGHPVRAGSPH